LKAVDKLPDLIANKFTVSLEESQVLVDFHAGKVIAQSAE
jgi:hypothetical protein